MQPSFSSPTAVFDLFIQLHHEAISKWVSVSVLSWVIAVKDDMTSQVKDVIISRVGLEGWEERVAVLSWALRTYPGDQLMADPILHGGNPKVLPPLLDRQTVTTLQSEYLRAVSDDYQGTDFND